MRLLRGQFGVPILGLTKYVLVVGPVFEDPNPFPMKCIPIPAAGSCG